MIQTVFGSIPQEPSLLDRLKAGVEKTRSGLVGRLEEALAGRKEIDAALLAELEYTLGTAAIGGKASPAILGRSPQPLARHLPAHPHSLTRLTPDPPPQ